MIVPILHVIVIQIVLPAAFIYSLWRAKTANRLDWIIQLLFTSTLIVWLFLSRRWDWPGYYFKYIWPILLMPAVYFSWKKTKNLPFRTPLKTGQKVSRGIYIFLLLIFGLYNINAVIQREMTPSTLIFPYRREPIMSGMAAVPRRGRKSVV